MSRQIEVVLTPTEALWLMDRVVEAHVDGKRCPISKEKAEIVQFQATAEVVDDEW